LTLCYTPPPPCTSLTPLFLKKLQKSLFSLLILFSFIFVLSTCAGEGPAGEDGDKGERGKSGTAIFYKEELQSEEELYSIKNPGPDDIYLIKGDLWVWDSAEETWLNLGRIQGLQGPSGDQGPHGPQGQGTSSLDIVTVTYVLDGGSGVSNEKLLAGGGAREPSPSSVKKYVKDFPVAGLFYGNSIHTFLGWELEGGGTWDFNEPVTEDITLIAKYGIPVPIDVSSSTGANIFAKSINYLNNIRADLPADATEWLLVLDEDVTAANFNKSNSNNSLGLYIKGIGDEQIKITLSSATGTLCSVYNSYTPITIDNINLIGSSGNNTYLVEVNNNVSEFTMINSKISGNTSSGIAGVNVRAGSFNMIDSEISGNTSTGTGASAVSVGGGTFNMTNSKISGNTSNAGATVSVNSGTFNMTDSEISGNDGLYYVLVEGGALFMNGGRILSTSSQIGVYLSVAHYHNNSYFIGSAPGYLLVSGSAEIESITLMFSHHYEVFIGTSNTTTTSSQVTVAQGWSGHVGQLNLIAENNTNNNTVDTVPKTVSYWYNATPASSRVVIAADEGYVLTGSDIAKFTLGNSIANPITVNTPISTYLGTGFRIGTSGERLGKLEPK
jgi:hypothetical protein